ncbi:MAG: transporter [Candidatus Ratteibacteria bacterium]
MKKKDLKIYAFVISFFFLSTFVYAGRPLTTDDAETVEKGKFELEIGYDFIKNDKNSQELGISLKSGLTEFMDFGISAPFVIEEDGEGINEWGNAEIGAKFSILKEKENRPGFSFTVSATPNPDDGDKRYGINLILSKNFGKLTTHLNFGRYSLKTSDENEDILNYSGAFEYSINEKFNFVGEIVGENNKQNPLELLFGINYATGENLTYDIGISLGLNDDTPDYRITTGITLNW